MTLDTGSASFKPRTFQFLSVAAIAALALTACNGDNGDDDTDAEDNGDADVTETEESGDDAETGGTLTIEDDHGSHEINLDEVDSIGAFDNRVFRTLQEFGVELSVAPVDLMNDEAHGDYIADENILNTGNHREPNLELIVAAEPDLVINGQRYAQYYNDIAGLLPEDSVILEFDEGTRDPNTFFQGLQDTTEALGEIFGAQDEAEQINSDLTEAMARVEAAYDGESSVMGLLTSGGDINYAGPNEGRGVAPVFQEFDLVPALEVDDQSSDHEGDDISVEAIADSNPDWIIVLDRDGMNPDDPEYTPASELIADSPALQQVTAIEEDQIVYMPTNMYTTEDIQAYTEFLNDFADALEAAQ